MQIQGLKALVFGSTGAIGAQLVAILLASPAWSKVHCIARKRLDQWNTLKGRQKLTVQTFDDLDEYFKQQNKKYVGFDSVFCCFGSQTKHGEQTFVKIDKTYPLWAADIAIKNNIPHYLLLSSAGSDQNSWFLYPRTKGQAEQQLKLKKINLLSIFRPGILRHRRDARLAETIFGKCPFVPKIQAIDCAQVLRIVAEKYRNQALKVKEISKTYDNSEMLQVLQQ